MSTRKSSRRSAKGPEVTTSETEKESKSTSKAKKTSPSKFDDSEGIVEEYQPSPSRKSSRPRATNKKFEESDDSSPSKRSSPSKKPTKATPIPTPSPSKRQKRNTKSSKASSSDEIVIDDIKPEIKEELDDEMMSRKTKTTVIEIDSKSDDSDNVNEPETILSNAPVLTAAGLSAKIELGKGTKDKCGECTGCLNEICRICTACKRGDYKDCIDKYCDVEEKGREARAAAKELYMKSMGFALNKDTGIISKVVRAQDGPGSYGYSTQSDRKRNRSRNDDNCSDEDQENRQNQNKKARKTNYVYGGKTTASKIRRCGECEGCMRDDCGECVSCLDKPRFGGKGTKKRACVQRTCRMKAKGKLKTAASVIAEAAGADGEKKEGDTPELVQGEDGIYFVVSSE